MVSITGAGDTLSRSDDSIHDNLNNAGQLDLLDCATGKGISDPWLFDEATSSLDTQTAEHFAATVNQLKGQVTMLFITHALPRNLLVDEGVRIGGGVAAVGEAGGTV